MSHVDFNWGAMVLSAVAAFIIGFLWYGPLFGRRWGEEMGFDMDADKPPLKEMALPMGMNFVGNFLLAYSLTWVLHGFAGHWGGFGVVIMGALIIWTGFYLPVGLSRKGWEQRTWTFVGIDLGHALLALIVVGTMVYYIPF